MQQSFALNYGLLKTGLPLVIVKVFNLELCFLLDTGSNRNIIDERVYNHFKDKLNIVGENEEVSTLQSLSKGFELEIPFLFEGSDYNETFICTGRIDGFDLIEEESGIQIHGILGSNFLLKYGWVIDFDNMMVSLNKLT